MMRRVKMTTISGNRTLTSPTLHRVPQSLPNLTNLDEKQRHQQCDQMVEIKEAQFPPKNFTLKVVLFKKAQSVFHIFVITFVAKNF